MSRERVRKLRLNVASPSSVEGTTTANMIHKALNWSGLQLNLIKFGFCAEMSSSRSPAPHPPVYK